MRIFVCMYYHRERLLTGVSATQLLLLLQLLLPLLLLTHSTLLTVMQQL